MLWLLTLARLIRYPERLVRDMVDHARGPDFFTIVAGNCILGTQFHIVAGQDAIAAAFWWLSLTLWGIIMYLFLHRRDHTRREAQSSIGHQRRLAASGGQPPLGVDPYYTIAMYTTGTLRLSAALEAPFLMRIPELKIRLVLLAWGATNDEA